MPIKTQIDLLCFDTLNERQENVDGETTQACLLSQLMIRFTFFIYCVFSHNPSLFRHSYIPWDLLKWIRALPVPLQCRSSLNLIDARVVVTMWRCDRAVRGFFKLSSLVCFTRILHESQCIFVFLDKNNLHFNDSGVTFAKITMVGGTVAAKGQLL